MDITQAYLLEKALGGSVDVGNGVVSSRTDLAADPNPPDPPPPAASVLDLALLLNIHDECVVRRAFSQTGMLHWWEYNAVYLCAAKHYLLDGVCMYIHTTNQLNVNCIFVCLCWSLAPKPGTDADTAAATSSHPTDKNVYLAQIPHR